jgi:hypothetical protein
MQPALQRRQRTCYRPFEKRANQSGDSKAQDLHDLPIHGVNEEIRPVSFGLAYNIVNPITRRNGNEKRNSHRNMLYKIDPAVLRTGGIKG